MAHANKKHRFDTFGYGALALYAGLMVLLALSVYGINLTSVSMRLNETERTRAQMRSGKMVVVTSDREQCRAYNFDNQTADVTAEKMLECEKVLPPEKGSASFNIFQRGFQSR